MRNDRFLCHLGHRQPRVKLKGKLVGAGVDSNECRLLIMHFRGAGSWLLFVASANTKVTVTSPLIRKRFPSTSFLWPLRKVCGKHVPLPKIPAERCCGGLSWGNGLDFVFFFHFGAKVSQLKSRRISACEHLWLFSLSVSPSSQTFQRRNHNDTIHPPHNSVQVGTHILNLRAWVNNQKETQSVAASPSSHRPYFGQPPLPVWLGLGWAGRWQVLQGRVFSGGELLSVVFVSLL